MLARLSRTALKLPLKKPRSHPKKSTLSSLANPDSVKIRPKRRLSRGRDLVTLGLSALLLATSIVPSPAAAVPLHTVLHQGSGIHLRLEGTKPLPEQVNMTSDESERTLPSIVQRQLAIEEALVNGSAFEFTNSAGMPVVGRLELRNGQHFVSLYNGPEVRVDVSELSGLQKTAAVEVLVDHMSQISPAYHGNFRRVRFSPDEFIQVGSIEANGVFYSESSGVSADQNEIVFAKSPVVPESLFNHEAVHAMGNAIRREQMANGVEAPLRNLPVAWDLAQACDGNLVSGYGSTSPEEDFAEFGTEYMQTLDDYWLNGDEVAYQQLAQEHPHRHAIFRANWEKPDAKASYMDHVFIRDAATGQWKCNTLRD